MNDEDQFCSMYRLTVTKVVFEYIQLFAVAEVKLRLTVTKVVFEFDNNTSNGGCTITINSNKGCF